MSDEDALLSAIAAHPDEDTPRLAYADWLDEHDRPIRAEFIRVQIEISRKETLPRVIQNRYVDLWKRNQELLDNHRDELFGPVPDLPHVEVEFRRGFVSQVRIPAFRYVHHADEIAAMRPIPDIIVWGAAQFFDAAGDAPVVRLRYFTPCHTIEMQSPHDAPTPLRAEDIRDAFATSLFWDRLRELNLEGCQIGDDGVEHLVGGRVPVLADLDLSGNDLTDAAVMQLLRSGLPRQLKRLILGGNPISDFGARLLAEQWPTGADDRLEHLNLKFTDIGQPGQQALLARFGGRVDLF
jgi:uncharacterized protein (TIGR02996 family)